MVGYSRVVEGKLLSSTNTHSEEDTELQDLEEGSRISEAEIGEAF